MGYSPWGCQESDTTEQLTLLLSVPGSNPEYLLPNLESFSFYYIMLTLYLSVRQPSYCLF